MCIISPYQSEQLKNDAKVLSEFMGGKVMGHALKHSDPDTGDLGPLTIQIRLEDSAGVNACKAEILVPRSYRHRFPIGARVRGDLMLQLVTQHSIKMEFTLQMVQWEELEDKENLQSYTRQW
jgi:hypothetical protein